MLKQFRENLREGGLLILAVVLPFQPFVEKGGTIVNTCTVVNITEVLLNVLRCICVGVNRCTHVGCVLIFTMCWSTLFANSCC